VFGLDVGCTNSSKLNQMWHQEITWDADAGETSGINRQFVTSSELRYVEAKLTEDPQLPSC
jgi:hypothetical protein